MRITILSLLALAAGTLTAAPRTLSQARNLAEKLLTERSGRYIQVQEAEASTQYARSLDNVQLRPYFAFNGNDGHSFVLISGSDLMPELLGYSTQSALPSDLSQLPDNMRQWLNYIAEVQDYAEAHPEETVALESAQATTEPITPFVKSKWGQDWPYNLLAPTKNGIQGVTGCVATSISQVLYYNGYPKQPTGSFTYYDSGSSTTMDFSKYTFEYDKMTDTYSKSSSTDEETNAVATLMRCVGHAVSMQYSCDASYNVSGTTTFPKIRGVVDFLNCTRAESLAREYYDLDEWNQILQEELLDSRPIVFAGQSSTGGHSFLLDGLDKNGLYHVNWGWDGYYDGYFDVSIMHTKATGTGATSSENGFASSQDVMLNVCDPGKAGKWHSQIVGTSNLQTNKTSYRLGDKLTLSISTFNRSPLAFSGKVGVLITDESGNEVNRSMVNTAISINASKFEYNRYGGLKTVSYGSKDLSISYTLPASLQDGKYRIYMCIRPSDRDEYDYVHVTHTRTSYRTMTVSGSNVTISSDAITPEIEITGWNFEEKQLKTAPVDIVAHLQNNSNESFALTYTLQLTDPDGTALSEMTAVPVTLLPGETGDVSFSTRLTKEGTWTAKLTAKDYSVSERTTYTIDQRSFDVELDPTYGADFTVSKKLWAASDTVWSIGPATFMIELNNAGAAYHGEMAVRLFSNKSSTADKYLIAEIKNDVQFAANTTDTVTLTGDLNITKLTAEKATLYARFYYQQGESMVSMSSNPTTITLYKGEASAIEAVMQDDSRMDLTKAVIYNIAGQRVLCDGTLPAGIYIVNGKKQIIR